MALPTNEMMGVRASMVTLQSAEAHPGPVKRE